MRRSARAASPQVCGVCMSVFGSLGRARVRIGARQHTSLRLARYGVVGVSGIGVITGLFWLLHAWLGLQYLLAGALASEMAICTNYLLNNNWTFRDRFNQTWEWTRRNLMRPDGLLAWNWRDGAIVDANGATDADVDTAYALLLAGRRWNDRALTEAGQTLVRAIWAQEVMTVNGAPYLAAGNWATSQPIVAINPSYFAPYALRVFAEVDPARDWRGLIDTGYRALFESSAALLGSERSSGLPPDWVGLERASGRFVPLRFNQDDTTRYGYDAARTYWRVALDSRVSGDGRAEAYLRTAGFLQYEVQRKGYVSGVYAHDGTVLQEAPTLVGIAGGIAALQTLAAGAAQAVFAGQMLGGMAQASAGAYWGNPDDLYGQEWAWFATALYANTIRNVWAGS